MLCTKTLLLLYSQPHKVLPTCLVACLLALGQLYHPTLGLAWLLLVLAPAKQGNRATSLDVLLVAALLPLPLPCCLGPPLSLGLRLAMRCLLAFPDKSLHEACLPVLLTGSHLL